MKVFDPFLSGRCHVYTELWDHLRDRTLRALAEGMREKEAVATPEEVRRRGDRIRGTFLESIGGLPPSDSPLNARTAGIVVRPGCHIEKVVFESRPKAYVTALLYVPNVPTFPVPGILFVSGHHRDAKGNPEYQRVCLELVSSGFVVLATDPTGQGERVTTFDPATGEMSHGWGTTEHSYQGQQCILAGTSIARYFLHDALRAVDYLQSRPEVDPDRIGVTGNSGGGTQTTLVCLSGDERIKAAAPCTYVTSRESYFASGQPQDAEQLQFGMTANGINFDDMFLPFAPRPLLIGGVRADFFSPEGTQTTYERLRRLYGVCGREGDVGLAWGPGGHRYSRELREAAVNWFRRHLLGTEPDFRTREDDAIETLPDSDLWCTSKGHVLTDYPDCRTPQHETVAILDARPPRAAGVDLRATVAEALGISARMDAPFEPFARVGDPETEGGLTVRSVDFLSEAGIHVAGGLLAREGAKADTAVLYLADGGTERIDDHLPRLRDDLDAGKAVFVFDVRGTGAVRADEVNAHGSGFPGLYYGTVGVLSFGAYCLGESLLGMRVFDALCGIRFLREQIAERVEVRAEGLEPALWGYLAAALDESVAATRIEGLIESYEAVARAPFYRRDLGPAAIVHGLLRRFDLPDLRSLFEGRSLAVTTVPVTE